MPCKKFCARRMSHRDLTNYTSVYDLAPIFSPSVMRHSPCLGFRALHFQELRTAAVRGCEKREVFSKADSER